MRLCISARRWLARVLKPEGLQHPSPARTWRSYRSFLSESRSFLSESANTLRTTPWMAWVPKCVVAGAPNTRVMFEFGTEYGTSLPPVMQTCSVDEGGLVSKGAMLPFPVNTLTVPLN